MTARRLDRLLGLPAESVRAARGIAEILREVRNHHLGDAAIDRSRRRIVKVDRKLHAATFSEGLKSLMTATGLPPWVATRSGSGTEERESCIFSLSGAPRTGVIEGLLLLQFSFSAHLVAS